MPRLSVTPLTRIQRGHAIVAAQRLLSSTPGKNAGDQNATPGWEGRKGDDHVVNRSEHDTQAEASQSGMRKKEKGEDGSGAISQKDERNSNERAKDEFPEAPGPVIGMNSERGSKGS